MFIKVICFASVIAAVFGNYVHHVAFSEQSMSKRDDHPVVVPVGGYHGHGHAIDYHTHPKYEFGYKVVDTYTGDIKSQQEHRDGDVVKGNYAFHQPNGVERVVNYYSDDHKGFLADVKYGHISPRYGN
ncbi:cuticle protein 19-like [Zerene cesonia]|uniref:cuticle protein 19-like n=1 Tax=Zerene cesonia TaxID=33412 RepID=UPI0018E4FC7C|nr:cuticle protein 19-like [Zerene cesonia]